MYNIRGNEDTQLESRSRHRFDQIFCECHANGDGYVASGTKVDVSFSLSLSISPFSLPPVGMLCSVRILGG